MAPTSSPAAPAGALAIAGSVVFHGALLLFALRAAAAAPVVAKEERLVDLDLVPALTAVPSPPPPPVPVATEPQVRATPLHTPPPPLAHEVAPRATAAAAVAGAVAAAPAQEAAPALTADQGMPSFTISIGGGSAQAHGAVSALGAPRAPVVDAPVPEQGVSSPARLARGGTPPYPPVAREEGVEGDVVLELVLSTAGTVDSVKLIRGAGHGLDDAAVAAVRNYRFSPATKDGRPVRVRMHWTMQFRLQ